MNVSRKALPFGRSQVMVPITPVAMTRVSSRAWGQTKSLAEHARLAAGAPALLFQSRRYPQYPRPFRPERVLRLTPRSPERPVDPVWEGQPEESQGALQVMCGEHRPRPAHKLHFARFGFGDEPARRETGPLERDAVG